MSNDFVTSHDEMDCVLGLELLRSMDMAVLKRVGPRTYKVCGRPPDFYSQLFPADADGDHCSTPWEYSPMLDFFLDESENFFNDSTTSGFMESGIWLEETDASPDGEMPLAAYARKVIGGQVIIVKQAALEYDEKVHVLRKARIILLERRQMSDALSSLQKKSLYDGMTQLYNRETFLNLLKNQIESRPSYDSNLALLMIDIDHFKKVNDTYGHLAGDSVLAQLGHLLKLSLRAKDMPARYGGEEFAVVAPDTSLPQSLYVAEKIRQKVEEHDFQIAEGQKITVSVGCTIYRLGESREELIHRADQALYDAKHQGRNRVCQRDPWTSRP